MYAPDSKRTPKLVLRLHNLVYQHGRTCNDLFIQSSNPVFSRYFHSITCHSPLLLRISLRSVNTEMQEHLFGQAKQITKGTSSLKPNHVISNILVRMHEENKVRSIDPLAIQEGEIHKLAQMLGPTVNTVIPYSWLSTHPTLHQAHLERISDFLLPGPGVWWRHNQAGIEFLDGSNSPSQHPEGPDIHHVRSTLLSDIDIYLHHKWEECCMKCITMPVHHICHYGSDGSLSMITAQSVTTESTNVSNLHVEANIEACCPYTPAQPNTEENSSCTPQFNTRGSESQTQFQTSSPNPAQEICTTSAAPDQHECNTISQLPSSPALKTSLAKTISQVIPTDSTLQCFDFLRSKVKRTKQNGGTTHSVHLSALSHKVKEALLSRCEELSTTIANWKQTHKEYTKEMQDAAHKLNIARKLLKHEWKITT